MKTKSIVLKKLIGETLEDVRKEKHPLATFNMFGNFIVGKCLLDYFDDILPIETKKQIKEVIEI